MDSAALLAHIVSQTRQNVEFLISQNHISPDNGRDILLKLPSSPISPSSNASIDSLTRQTQNLIVQTPSPSTAAAVIASSAPNPIVNPPRATQHAQPPPPTGPTVLFQAKAMWNYNEHGQSPGDLSFFAGETIDIIAETNADWWTGSHKGKQGLFPSNYVEKIPSSAVLPSPALTPYSEKVQGEAYSSYKPTGGYQGAPPPLQSGYAPYGPGAPVQPVHPATNAAPESPKKSKFGGGLKNTLAHSAVGGVGFGAGSAVGSGLINSIF